MNILITGSNGFIARNVIPMLVGRAHTIRKLVRAKPEDHDGEFHWDPRAGRIDPEALQGIDAVIHLAGENIGEGRWTARKKKEILESRSKGTGLLAETIARTA